MAWVNAYLKAVTHVKFVNGRPVVPPAADGPVPVMLATEYTMGRSGALDTDLLAQRDFYGTNFTKPLLFMGDGAYFSGKAAAMNLTGDQWGVMNETGSYPGQPWLWLYTLWYYVPGFSASANVDLIAVYLTGLATILLLADPLHPRPARHPALDPRPPPHLAQLGAGHRRHGRRHGRHRPGRRRRPRHRPRPRRPAGTSRPAHRPAGHGRAAHADTGDPARAGRPPARARCLDPGRQRKRDQSPCRDGRRRRGWIVSPRNPAGGSDDGRCAARARPPNGCIEPPRSALHPPDALAGLRPAARCRATARRGRRRPPRAS